MKRISWLFVAVLFGSGTVAYAQDAQSRLIFHPTVTLNEHWFLTGWAIGNVQKHGSDNLNLFAGVGYKNPKWWLESMVQRHWNGTGNQVLLNFRFQVQASKRGTLYIEGAPFLTKRAFYDFVTFDYRILRKLNLGAETENVHRGGRDSLGVGPRISYPIASVGKTRLAAAFSYQFRREERDVARLYLIVHHQF